MKNIYLVRHAQSEANVNVKSLHSIPNPSISLTSLGFEQAKETGQFLAHHDTLNCIIWNSPYKRTRQTAQVIKEQFNSNRYVAKESIYLSERQFGLLDDVASYQDDYIHAVKHFKRHVDTNTEFFVRPMLGESPFDMCLRLDSFIHQNIISSKIDKHIIVSHGAAIRGIMMMCMGWEFEEYLSQPNLSNAGVIHLQYNDNNWQNNGIIFNPSVVTR